MSFDIVNTVNFPQEPFQYVPQEILCENAFEDLPTLGGILSDLKHTWHAKGPCLEIRNTSSGRKVGSWTFGGILKDSNTKVITVGELKRSSGRLPLLVVALDCTISGGLVCVFDIFGSKVLRVVQVRDQITSLYVVDSGCENSVLPEPSPLRYFDGIVAIGTVGGNVYLLDICRQICENAILNLETTTRDELNPSPMVILSKEKLVNVKKYVQRSVENEEHLAVHINLVSNPSTEHFTLKGEHGDDRVHVNKSEAEVSSMFYSPQIASLLVGYNFGAFQLWDLRSLKLTYTSPICDEHIPVMHFTVQEPADDPKAYCYIWVSYSHNHMFHSGLPFAVMYSFYYENKNYLNGYGVLYEDFQHCSVRFEIELGDTQSASYKSQLKGGICLGLQSLNKYPINKDLNSLSLCLISWLVWNHQKEVSTSVLVFDLNQWYKEQMPRVPNWLHCSNYIIKHNVAIQVLDVKLDQKSLSQFIGIQRLEEHFCPTALSFDVWGITEDSILKMHNKGLQQTFIDKIMSDQHLALVRPEDYFEQISSLGLVPLFCEMHVSNSMDIDSQREMLLNVVLEQKLLGWLCHTTSKLANNSFNACGLALYNVLNWAFERALTLKNACDQYCVSLFDYSGVRLDNNTIALLNSSTSQIRNICSLYRYISSKLMNFVSNKEGLLEEQRALENVVVYFEVLLWMVNIGLLPECQQKNCAGYDDSFVSAPYLVQDLKRYYDRKRVQLQMACSETFVEKDCLLFVDNLINNKGGAEVLRQQWQEDGGSGLYPPPSLQSVLRTYFLDGPDLVFKHSLVTYTLLDIAMTVNENNKVIKLLLKFPQIFDLSQSHIKIVQAFWHLDHDDYETALGYILDPCVLTENLQHWHHSVMMRSLLLQDQSSLALLYLQIRKPSIQNEKDLLTVISLLISKNMLDEAFKFRQQYHSPNEQALLQHIFDECNKNEQLHSLLYRRLSNDEEKAFFKYLQGARNPRCEDLKLFYYLLRSRFLEAFDTYSATKRKKPENQGLVGQRDATTADNIVKMFKSLLPDVNRNLMELVRKERANLWREVPKPTPLSVFVHNAHDQVRYKSSVIFAALAKAKQTFNDSLNDGRAKKEVTTEDTPFLKTPTAFREKVRVDTPVMKSKVIEQNEQGEEYGPSPCKKLKLSPRTSKMSTVKSRNNLSLSSSVQSKISTPIIRRVRPSTEHRAIDTTAVLPQSILKGGSMTRTFLDDSILDENTSVNTSLQLECENSVRRSRFGLTPRKPVSRTPNKFNVKFDDLRYSDGSTEQNSKNESYQLLPETTRRESVNSTASTIDEIFYSPDNSMEINADFTLKTPGSIEDESRRKTLSPVREKIQMDVTVTEDNVFEELPKKKKEAEIMPVEENDLSTNRLTFQSPKSRKSYKRSFGEFPPPVRSSPRLAKKAEQEEKEDSTSSERPMDQSESLLKPSPSTAVQKVSGRKSLSRAVLEHNAFSRTQTSNVFDETKDFRSKSILSSANSTLSVTESDVDMDQSRDDSLEEFLNKYRRNTASSSKRDDSLMFGSEEGEVVSKTTEVHHVETYKESVRKTDTQELVSSKETQEEYYSKKVEEFVQDDDSKEAQEEYHSKKVEESAQDDDSKEAQEEYHSKKVEEFVQDDDSKEAQEEYHSKNVEESVQDDNSNEAQKDHHSKKIEESLRDDDSREAQEEYHSKKDDHDEIVDQSVFDEDTQEFHQTATGSKTGDDIVKDDQKSEAGYSDVTVKQPDGDEAKETRALDEEINIYEDLSSGSEDTRAVLLQFKKKDQDAGKVYADISSSTGGQYYQSGVNVSMRPEGGESNSNDDPQKTAQPEYHTFDNDIYMEELYGDIPDTEKAFITEDVIEIGSSSDEDDQREQKHAMEESMDSSQSSSSSSSEESSYLSSKADSDDLNVAFESNLQDRAGSGLTNEENNHSCDSEEKIIEPRDVPNKEIEIIDENLEQKAEELLYQAPVAENPLSNDNDVSSSHLERQYELEQQEIVEEQNVPTVGRTEETDNDEHMDSLLLEESPEKDVKESKEPFVVKFSEESAITCDDVGEQANEDLKAKDDEGCFKGFGKENLETDQKEKTVTTIPKESQINENILVEADQAMLLTEKENFKEFDKENSEAVQKDETRETNVQEVQINKNVLIETDKMVAQDVEEFKGFEKKDCPKGENSDLTSSNVVEGSSPLKESKSLQCTLGVKESDLETSRQDEAFEGSENLNRTTQKVSKSMQCTLGAADLVMEVTELKETTPPPVDTELKEQEIFEKQSRSLQCTLGNKDVVLEESVQESNSESPKEPIQTGTSQQIESKGLQCTLGAKDLPMDETVADDASVCKAEEEKMIVSKSKHSIGLQNTMAQDDTIMDSSDEEDTSVSLMESSSQEEEGTPLLMRSVKRTYKGRKASENIDATPTLAKKLTKRTYARKESGLGSKLFDGANSSEAEASKVPEDDDLGKKRDDADDSNKEASVAVDVNKSGKVLDDAKEKVEDSEHKEMPDSSTKEDANLQQEKEKPARRVTRKRSTLLSQQEGTLASVSEESMVSSGGDSKELKGAMDGSSVVTEPSGGSETSGNRSSASKKSSSSRRVTRQSQLADEQVEVDSMETSVLEDDTAERLQGGEENLKNAGPSKVRLRRSSKNSTKNEPSTSVAEEPMKRTRSASVDQPSSYVKKRSTRSKSIDFDDVKDTDTDSKGDLRVLLTPIQEKPGPSSGKEISAHEVPKLSTKAYSDVGAYTTSRRLTRRQASMLKTIGSTEKGVKNMPTMEEMDPLHLLEKSEFAGKADPDESRVYDKSSPSNSSGTPSRHTRSASVLSDVVLTPKRKTKARIEHIDSPISGIKSRLRRQSTDTLSVTSEQSDSPSPSKRSKKKENDEMEADSLSVKSAKRGRSRTNSVSSTRSVASDKSDSSVRTTRSRRLHSAKSELPEIQEEKNSDEAVGAADTSVVKRRGRKKKE